MKNIVNKFMLTLAILLVVLLSSCKKDKQTTTTEESIMVEKIEVSLSGSESVYQSFTYNHSDNVIVYAYYSDNTTKNVTQECVFNKISTSTVGVVYQKVEYTFNGKTVSSGYEVLVLEYGVSKIEIDYSSCKMIYKVGEKIDFTNLTVKAYYPSGSYKTVSNPTMIITNNKNIEVNNNSAFQQPGKYDVKVSYEGQYKSYPIIVYQEYDVVYKYLASKSIGYIDNSTQNFSTLNTIFKSPYAYITAEGEKICYSYEDINYNDTNYSAAIDLIANYDGVLPKEDENYEVNFTDGLKLTVLEDCQIIMLVDNNGLNIRDEDDNIKEYIGVSNGLGLIYFELEVGSYYLTSLDHTLIYDITFNFLDVSEYDYYDFLSINYDELTTKYGFYEKLDTSNLKVYGVKDGETELLSTDDYTVELIYNNELINKFLYSGNYTVKVTYIGNSYLLKNTYSYNVNYSLKLIEEHYLYILAIDGKELPLEIDKFNYTYSTSNDSINLNLMILGNYNIYVNGHLYEENILIELEDGLNEIVIEIKGEYTCSYLLSITKISNSN